MERSWRAQPPTHNEALSRNSHLYAFALYFYPHQNGVSPGAHQGDARYVRCLHESCITMGSVHCCEQPSSQIWGRFCVGVVQGTCVRSSAVIRSGVHRVLNWSANTSKLNGMHPWSMDNGEMVITSQTLLIRWGTVIPTKSVCCSRLPSWGTTTTTTTVRGQSFLRGRIWLLYHCGVTSVFFRVYHRGFSSICNEKRPTTINDYFGSPTVCVYTGLKDLVPWPVSRPGFSKA